MLPLLHPAKNNVVLGKVQFSTLFWGDGKPLRRFTFEKKDSADTDKKVENASAI